MRQSSNQAMLTVRDYNEPMLYLLPIAINENLIREKLNPLCLQNFQCAWSSTDFFEDNKKQNITVKLYPDELVFDCVVLLDSISKTIIENLKSQYSFLEFSEKIEINGDFIHRIVTWK